MKLISWNVNGLRACIQKGFLEYFDQFDADFFCLQETKLSEGQLALELPGYHQFWCYAEKKGYSGTAVFTKHEPLSVHYGLDVPELDTEGRLITLEYPEFFLVTCYTPNAQRELARIDHRIKWDESFRAYLQKLDTQKPVILCGDLNVAHQEIDLKNPKTNRGNAGFSDQERESFGKTLAMGFTDTFRHLHPDAKDQYTWWSYMFKAREKNAGWRIDYFLVSERIRDTVYRANIHSDIPGSDHCPVSIETDLPCNGGIFSHSAPGKAQDMSKPEKREPPVGASAAKAKALTAFISLLLLVLTALLLWPQPTAFQTPTENPQTETAHPDIPFYTVKTYPDLPVYYSQAFFCGTFFAGSTTTMQPEDLFSDLFLDGEEHCYVPDTYQYYYNITNIALRITLNPDMEHPADPNQFKLQLTPTQEGYSDITLFARPYYSDLELTQFCGWILLANIPDSGIYELTLSLDGEAYGAAMKLNLSPGGQNIPSDQDTWITITDLTDSFGQVSQTTSDGVTHIKISNNEWYTPALSLNESVTNASFWYFLKADPNLTDNVPLDQLTINTLCSAHDNTSSDYTLYIPSVCPLYKNPQLQNLAGWLIYADVTGPGSLEIQLSWYASDGINSLLQDLEINPVSGQTLSTNALLERITNSEVIAQQLFLYEVPSLSSITPIRYLLEKNDCIDAMLYYDSAAEDPYGYLIMHLLSHPEFLALMNPAQEVAYLTGNYTSCLYEYTPLSLPTDETASEKPTEYLANRLLLQTRYHKFLLDQCSDQATQLEMLNHMASQSNTLAEFLSREDRWQCLLEYTDHENFEDSILSSLAQLLPMETPDTPMDPDLLSDRNTEHLVYAILLNPSLCDRILESSPDFFGEPMLAELASRDDAVSILMNWNLSENIMNYWEIPYRLLCSDTIRQRMTPTEEANFLLYRYPSCPFELISHSDELPDIAGATSYELVAAILKYGDADQLRGCTTAESAYSVLSALCNRSEHLMELFLREDAGDALNEYYSTGTYDSGDEPILRWMITVWPMLLQGLITPE